MSNITPDELLERMKNVDLSQYRKRKPSIKEPRILEPSIYREPLSVPQQNLPIVSIECITCKKLYIGRGITTPIVKLRRVAMCPYCFDAELWWWHHGLDSVVEVR